MSESNPNNIAGAPSPSLFLETANAYQRSAALHSAVELGLFTAIGTGGSTAAQAAASCESSERGVRILCDYLTIIGFLIKEGDVYKLTPDSAMFLDKGSRAYLGGTLQFLHLSTIKQSFQHLTEAVRKGGTALPGHGSVEDDHPMWVDFAQAMQPTMMIPAMGVAKCLSLEKGRKIRILDIAAGHGIYGIVLAQQNPNVEVVALDWQHVLDVAVENAHHFGVGDRYETLPGSAFDVDFGTGYDVVLLTNFLHHFDAPTCEGLLKKVHAALAPGGRAVTVDFVVNEDRISPPATAAFSLIMLASTPSGEAYTFKQYDEMFRNSGFSGSELYPLHPSPEFVVISSV